jgi:streptogramin lyase
VTVSPDGVLYVAALGQQGIARVGAETLDYIAGLFRGPSDLAYGSERLYVTNFDSFSLVVSAVGPRLPFTLSVVNLNGE